MNMHVYMIFENRYGYEFLKLQAKRKRFFVWENNLLAQQSQAKVEV